MAGHGWVGNSVDFAVKPDQGHSVGVAPLIDRVMIVEQVCGIVGFDMRADIEVVVGVEPVEHRGASADADCSPLGSLGRFGSWVY